MALNAGDMLYYDGAEWVNSSTIITPTAGLILEAPDGNTNNVIYPLQLRHTTSAPVASITSGFGNGIQFMGQMTNGGWLEFGNIQCVEVGTAPNAISSYLSFSMWNGNVENEILRLRPFGTGRGQVWCRGDFQHDGTKLGFFGTAETIQQTGGIATATSSYGANEQNMLQTAYSCLRTFGLLT